MRQYVVGFAFDLDKAAVVLMRKRRPDWQVGRLNGPGGKVKAGETPAEAMRREFREEAGLDTNDWRLFAVLSGADNGAPPRAGAIVDHFEVWFYRVVLTDAQGNQVQTTTDEPVAWYSLESGVPSHALPNLHWLLPMAGDQCAHDWPYCIVERAKWYDLV